MALHFEYAGIAIADIDHTGIFARSLDDPGRRCWQFTQVQTGRFVGTMLVPHRRKDAQLRKTWGAADQSDEALIFIRLQAMFGGKLRCDLWFVTAQNFKPSDSGPSWPTERKFDNRSASPRQWSPQGSAVCSVALKPHYDGKHQRGLGL